MTDQYIKVELYKQCRTVKHYLVDRASYKNGNSNDPVLVEMLANELQAIELTHKGEQYELGSIDFTDDLYISRLTYYHEDQNYPEDDMKGH